MSELTKQSIQDFFKQVKQGKQADKEERLRIEFACAAMIGLLADPSDHSEEIIPPETCAQAVARLAFEYADAALARYHLLTQKEVPPGSQ